MLALVLYFAANGVLFVMNKPTTTVDKVMTILFGAPIFVYDKVKPYLTKSNTQSGGPSGDNTSF